MSIFLILLLVIASSTIAVFGNECSKGEALFSLEITPNDYYYETTWIIKEVDGSVVFETPADRDPNASELLTYNYCLNSSKCFVFIIKDEGFDGLCCDYGYGGHRVFYNGQLLDYTDNENTFYYEDISPHFGDGCSSLSPSSLPTGSFFTDTPTISVPPTANPSVTPTLSFKPSMTPTKSFSPSASPTPFNWNHTESDRGRLRYPQRLFREEGSFNRQVLPNCNDKDRIGCVGYPSTIPLQSAPWASNNYFQPPKCEKRSCTMGLPKTFDALPNDVSKTSKVNYKDIPMKLSHEPWEIVVGDLNNDGLLDIVIAYGKDIVGENLNVKYENEVWMNLGNGDYDVQQLPGGAEFTRSLALGDLDNNGYLDIAVANQEGPNQVLLNYNGKFSETDVVDLSDGSSRFLTSAIALGDVNDDGMLDIIVGNYDEIVSNSILINRGGGRSYKRLKIPGSFTRSIAVGDLDGNGKVDIVLGNDGVSGNNGPLLILYNNGENNFLDVALDINFESNSVAIALGYINDDDRLDIVVGSGVGGVGDGTPAILYENLGNKEFEKKTLPGGVIAARGIALGDVNGDGRVDIVISASKANILFQNKGNSFESIDYLPFAQSVNQGAHAGNIAIGDMDNDGALDVIVGSKDFGLLFLMNSVIGEYHVENLPFNETTEFNNYIPRAVVLEDLNGDGRIDIIVGNGGHYDNDLGNERENEVYLMKDNGSFDTVQLPGGKRSTNAIAVGDLNGDNIVDIVVGNYGAPDQILMSIEKGLNGKIHNYNVMELSLSSTDTNDIALGDLDDNGLLDIVVADAKGNSKIYFNYNATFDEIMHPIKNHGGLFASQKDDWTIALGDLDGNGKLDIVFGRHLSNVILLNNGDKTFNVTEISSEDSPGKSGIALGDLNGDKSLDIVTANHKGRNQVLINDGYGSFTTYDLQHSQSFDNTVPERTNSVALGDMNGDGLLDIVFGNEDSKNYVYLNPGGTTFNTSNYIREPLADVPFDEQQPYHTTDIALGDLDDDGVIEVIVMNKNSNAQVVFYSSCPEGGAQLHSKSWCFNCPNYMGRPAFVLNHESSACLECLPDYTQLVGIDEQCSPFSCPYAERQLGQKTCNTCGTGEYYNSTIIRLERDKSSWEPPRCVKCPPGNVADESISAVDQCVPCKTGEYQDEEGQSSCKQCPVGEFQPSRGQTGCDQCALGGYCDSSYICGGGFTPCPQGTYNDEYAKSKLNDCKKCPLGTFSTTPEANSSSTCELCSPGSFTNETGQTSCQPCSEGTYQDEYNATSCKQCEEGFYSDKIGLVECIPCPYRLSSGKGDKICPFCAESFYLKTLPASEIELFSKPDDYCIQCPDNAICPSNTTLQTIGIRNGYWRDSSTTSTLYKCNNDVCEGSESTNSRRLSSTLEHGEYCAVGHTGPRCEVCIDKNQRFSNYERRCIDCPGQWRLSIPFIVVAVAMVIFVAIRGLAVHNASFIEYLDKCEVVFSNISAQAKFKIFISFYQVVTVLTPVYGVEMNNRFQWWFNFLNFFNFGFLNFGFPQECFRSMTQRLIIGAVWPFFLMLVGFIGIVIHAIYIHRTKIVGYKGTNDNLASFLKKVGFRSLYFITIFTYIVLPSVSYNTFNAIKCTSFETDDALNRKNTYLISDLDLQCDSSDNEYKEISSIFIGFFILWPILVPLAMFALLWKVQHSVRSKRTTALAEACSFLWRDYNETMWWWEILEIYRKLFLTGFILLLQRELGSSKVLRLLIAILVSILYFGILLRARPYKRNNDLDLAFLGNILLICCFVLGVSLHVCKEQEDTVVNNACSKYIHHSLDSYQMTLWTVILTAIMMLITGLSLVAIAVNAIIAPTIRLVSSGSKPNLEMPGECNFHAFLSHVWSTGQDKTHTIVRKLQLLMPGVRIWLDVDELSDMDQLEQSVENCVVVFIFYSSNYFQSKNCRREVYAAVSSGKPIYVLYTGDDSVVDEMKSECLKYCRNEGWDPEEIIQSVFTEEPIRWLGGSSAHYAIEAVKLISLCILRHLPFYKRVPGQLYAGLTVSGELGPVEFASSVDVLFCAGNIDARRIAEEAKSSLKRPYVMNILDIESIFDDDSLLDDTVMINAMQNRKRFLLLYLDENAFQDGDDGDDGKVSDLVRSAIDIGIKVVCVHERDSSVGGCSFDAFFSLTPRDLIDPPYQIFKDIAVPLYAMEMYRKVSLRQLLMKFGATQVGTKSAVSANGNLTASILATGSLVSSITSLRRILLSRSAQSRSRTTEPKSDSQESGQILGMVGEDRIT